MRTTQKFSRQNLHELLKYGEINQMGKKYANFIKLGILCSRFTHTKFMW